MIDKGSKIEKKRVSILGCGWLGFALAQRLRRADSTMQIKGSTTSASKLIDFKANHIDGYLIDLTPTVTADSNTISSFFDADQLVIALPPRLSKNEEGFYPKQIEAVVAEIEKSSIKEIIFISSTSIYPDVNRIVTEDEVSIPAQSASPEIVMAENIIQSLRPEKSVTVLRLGGLLGYNRNPGKYVMGKKDMETGSIPVNYIHRDDAAAIIVRILDSQVANETYNIVCGLHPTRREVYENTCKRFDWEAPTFKEPTTRPAFKVISNKKFVHAYPYDFIFPDPLEFYYSPGGELQ